jgi:hypothetical protein
MGGTLKNVSSNAQPTVTVNLPLITLNPNTGPKGTEVTVNGTSFHNNKDITITFNGSTVSTIPSPCLSDNKGNFSCSFTVPSITPGSYTVSDSDPQGTTASATFTVTKASTTVTLVSSLNPSVFGQSVTFTATVSAVAPATGTPTGTVLFNDSDSGITIGTGTLNASGQANISTSKLSGGSHNITANYTGDTNFTANASSILKQVVSPTSPAVTTALNQSTITLGGSVNDTVTVTGVPGITPTGTVYFNVSTDGSNWNTYDTETLDGTGKATSAGYTPLAAGTYYFRANYSGDSNYLTNHSVNDSEPLTVNQASPSVMTQLNQSSPITLGGSVNDTVTVTGVLGITPTGSVDFQNSSDGSNWNTYDTETLDGTGKATSAGYTPLAAGTYYFRANYSGDSNYLTNHSVNDSELLTVLQSGVTDLSLNISRLKNKQFTLLLIQDLNSPNTYKLTASNPGQFFDNIFIKGTPGSTIGLNISIPYPFVTQGAVPIHVYSNVTISGGSYVPSGDVTSNFTINPKTVSLSSYSPQAFGTNTTINVTGPVPPTGLVYVLIHLDYGFKGYTGYNQSGYNATNVTNGNITNLFNYTFSVAGDGITNNTTIQNVNTFKKDPGIAGTVTSSTTFNPIPGVNVTIIDPTKTIPPTTVQTDQNGFYADSFKWTGKAANFTVTLLPGYQGTNATQYQIVKSNQLYYVNFIIP